MKKYFCEAYRRELEKPTEPKYIFNTSAKCIVYAESDEEALVLAKEKMEAEYYGSGMKLGALVITKVTDLPVDWSYGYGDDRLSGHVTGTVELTSDSVIR